MAPAPIPAIVLAHQGGWDEILMVAGPLGVVAWLLWVADRRARRLDGTDSGTDPVQASSDDE